MQTGTEAGDSGEIESVVGPDRDVEERDEREVSDKEDDGWEEIDVALGYVVSGRDGRVLSDEEIRRVCVNTSNRFQMPEDMSEDEDDTTRDQSIFMVDSVIRKIDGAVCGKKTKTTTVCLPGARVEGVRKRVGKVLGPGKGRVYPGTCRDERCRQGRDDGATGELSTVGKGAEGQENREDRAVGNIDSGRRED